MVETNWLHDSYDSGEYRHMSFYKHYANRYRNPFGVRIKKSQAIQMVQNALALGPKEINHVLEIGPGDGYIAEYFNQSGVKYQAIERSENVATELASRGINIIQAACPPIPLDIGKVDLCFMLHVIEHMKDTDEASNIINDIFQHLTPGGLLIIATPDFMRWKEYFYDSDYTHSLPFTKRKLRQLLENEEYEIVRENIYTGPIFGSKGLPVYWVMKAFYPGFLHDILEKYMKHDFLNKAYLTFLPCLFLVARKTP